MDFNPETDSRRPRGHCAGDIDVSKLTWPESATGHAATYRRAARLFALGRSPDTTAHLGPRTDHRASNQTVRLDLTLRRMVGTLHNQPETSDR